MNLKQPSQNAAKSGNPIPMTFEFTKPRFLLCEGDDDKGFLETLIQQRGLPDFQVCHSAECNEAGSDGKGVGGRAGFVHSLTGFAPITSFKKVKAILIVTDNDTARSFRDVSDALTVNGHIAPATAADVGSVHGKPLAILMIPSSAIHGDLEKLCFPEVVAKWPKADQCVTDFLVCTGADHWAKQSSINKARLRSATVAFNEAEPYMGIGNLFRKGVLSTANACFNPIGDFLRAFDAKVGI